MATKIADVEILAGSSDIYVSLNLLVAMCSKQSHGGEVQAPFWGFSYRCLHDSGRIADRTDI